MSFFEQILLAVAALLGSVAVAVVAFAVALFLIFSS